MNLRTISSNVGKALLVNALFMLLSIIVSVADGFDEAFTPLVISFLITLITGAFPFVFVKSSSNISMREGFVIIVLSWLFSFIAGMLPYVMYGGEFTLVNAWFESVSGYTTTGSTILTEIESLPRSILFWRSSTHFIGGLGVVVFLLLILPDASPFKFRLSSLEISAMSRSAYRYRSSTVVKVMLSVYVGMAIVETLLLCAAGMSLFDAVNHSFSTVATGGFSTKNNSLVYFDSPAINCIIMVFMTLAATHFGVIYAVVVKRSFRPMGNAVTRYYLSVILVLSLSVALVLLLQGGYDSVGKAIMDSFFQVISFLTTTGFGTADNATWPFLANFILLYAAFHCGCSGSTTGGIKSDRMLIIFKTVANEFRHRLHPSSFIRTKIDGHAIKDETLSSVLLYFVTYVFILFISFLLVLMSGVEVSEAFSGTLVSIGNVGPGIGAIGTMGNYYDQPVMAKIVYTFDMFLGRLEIFPVLAVISMIFSRKANQ